MKIPYMDNKTSVCVCVCPFICYDRVHSHKMLVELA